MHYGNADEHSCFAQSDTSANDTQASGETQTPGDTDDPGNTENPDEPEVPEKTVVSASAYFGDIYKFINKGEKPDLSAGYIDFKFSDDTQERVLLTTAGLPPSRTREKSDTLPTLLRYMEVHIRLILLLSILQLIYLRSRTLKRSFGVMQVSAMCCLGAFSLVCPTANSHQRKV